ncbi:23673_t:CDS:1, partial [Racocetra persica]
DEILGPLFEHYLAVLFDLEVTFPLPMETIEDSNAVQTSETSEDPDNMQVEDDLNSDDQNVSQYDDNQLPNSSIKRKPETKDIKEIRELWKQKLEDMHYNSIYNEGIITNPFRNYLRVFVEEKIPYANEKLMAIDQSLSKRRKH